MKNGGGLITRDDLAAYRAKERQPVRGTFRGYEIIAPPPPSSGGVCLLEMLNVLENYDLKKQGRWSPETLHVIVEAQRRAGRDPARWPRGPGFQPTPAPPPGKGEAQEPVPCLHPKKAAAG